MLCAMGLTEVGAGLAGVCCVVLCRVVCLGWYRGRCWLGWGMLCLLCHVVWCCVMLCAMGLTEVGAGLAGVCCVCCVMFCAMCLAEAVLA